MFMSLAKLYESMFDDPNFLDDEENKMFFYGILDTTMNYLEKRVMRLLINGGNYYEKSICLWSYSRSRWNYVQF